MHAQVCLLIPLKSRRMPRQHNTNLISSQRQQCRQKILSSLLSFDSKAAQQQAGA